MSEQTPETPDVPTQAEELYDPSAHTVKEVQAYLDGAGADEVTRVKAAEQAGKNRDGIVGYGPESSEDPDGYTRVVISDAVMGDGVDRVEAPVEEDQQGV